MIGNHFDRHVSGARDVAVGQAVPFTQGASPTCQGLLRPDRRAHLTRHTCSESHGYRDLTASSTDTDPQREHQRPNHWYAAGVNQCGGRAL